jgi:hypothetical protein
MSSRSPTPTPLLTIISSVLRRPTSSARQPQAEIRAVPWSTITLVAVLVTSFAIGWHDRPMAFLDGSDDSLYLALSQSLREGHYLNSHYAVSTPHTKYPPGNPAWIALLQTIGGDHAHVVQAANVLLLLLTAALAGDAVRRLASPWLGVAAAAMVAWNRELLMFAGTLLAEIPFAATITLSAWAALRAAEEPRDTRWMVVSAAMALLAFLVRLNGIGAVLAVGGWFVLHRRWRAAAWYGVSAVVVIGAWAGWVWMSSQVVGPTYAGDLAALDAKTAGTAGLLAHLARNAFAYARLLVSLLSLPSVPGTGIDRLLWALVLATGTSAGMLRLYRTWPAVGLSLVLGGGILLAWPWPIGRLAVPYLPLIIALWMVGIFGIMSGLRRTRGAHLSVLGVALVCSFSALYDVISTARFRGCAGRDPYAAPSCFPPLAQSLILTARRADEVLPPDAVLASANGAAAWNFSRRRILQIPVRSRSGAWISGDSVTGQRWDAILATGYPAPSPRVLAEQLHAACEHLEVLDRSYPLGLILVRKSDGGENACGALADHLESLANIPPEYWVVSKGAPD